MNIKMAGKRTLFAAVALLAAGITLYGADGPVASQPSQPQASINGSISIKGGVELNTNSVNDVTSVTGWLNGSGAQPTVVGRLGDFAKYVAVGATVTMAQPWNVNSGPLPNFWSVGGFTFNLTASSVVKQGNGFLAFTGTGTISGNGFNPTPGTWRFSTQNPPANGVFSFAGSTRANPPATTPTPTPTP